MRAVSVLFVSAALCLAIEDDPKFDHQTTTYTADLKTSTDANVDATIVSPCPVSMLAGPLAISPPMFAA